jgi:hypothetical protein
VQHRRAVGQRLLGVHHGRQVLVADAHEPRGALGRAPRLGDDERDRLAVVEHAVDGERRVVADDVAEARVQRRGARAGDHPQHAFERLGLRRVDGDDARMRALGAHDRAVRHAGKREVERVARAAGDLGRAVEARDGLPGDLHAIASAASSTASTIGS